MNKGSYAGKISNKGPQVVKAPLSQGGSKGGKVIRGADLRTGKKG